MRTPVVPQVDCEQLHPGLVVADIPSAVEFYTQKLGFSLGFTWGEPPTFAGVNLGSVSVHLIQGTPRPSGEGAAYFVVSDADALFAFHRDVGVEVIARPSDQPYGLRDYHVRDPAGHILGFGHRLPEKGPPLKIERVDVPVRLEKRLAALLADLAAHKGMSLSSCLEETLLHTFEPLGNSVASPHTQATLRHIAELKRRHGIDYDTHASYRFVE